MGRTSKRLHGKQNLPFSDKLSDKRTNDYHAGIYARLSSDQDKRKNESVENQIDLAKRFVENWNQSHPDKINVVGCYTDLGKTGSNFNREAFQRLMQDIRMGDINCVIVKDLSRFGRNYLEAGNYIEKIFPFLGVRFISVADGYDTASDRVQDGQMASEIKNLVNDMYAKDFSRKARLSLSQRRQEGSYVGGPPPYGYVSVWEGKRRILLPDENTAEIVRYIYRKFIETEGYAAVANDLNQRRINPPAIYKKSGEVYCPPDTPYKGWDKSAVERILKSATYQGTLVQGKTNITAKNEKNRVHKKEKEWVVTEDTHKPLIDEETCNKAHEIREKIQERRKECAHPSQGVPIEENCFDKVLYCGVCGQKMTRNSYVKKYADGSQKRMDGYFCINGGASRVDSCPSSNRISKQQLIDLLFVLFEVEFSVHLEKQKVYLKKGEMMIEQERKKLEQKILLLRKEKERLDMEESDRYQEYRLGKLSQKDYVAYKMQREDKKREFNRQEEQFLANRKELERDGRAYLQAIRSLAKLRKGREFTKELLETLIERIYIYPDKRLEVLFTYGDFRLEGGM